MKGFQLKTPLAPEGPRPDFLIVAGEASGDEHAARMVEGLFRENPRVSVYAFGGKNLRAAGAHLLYDLTQHAVVGLCEVLGNLRLFRQLLAAVMDWVAIHRPRTVCLVDYPGFNLRLAKKLFQKGLSRKGGGEGTLYYYISPQVWAWKAKRRLGMARWLDHLALIFPFEKDFFADTPLRVSFVGHPLLEAKASPLLSYDPQGALLLLPGSRVATVRRLFPLMLETFRRLRPQFPQLSAAVLYADEGILGELQGMFAKYEDLRPALRFVSVAEQNLPCAASLMVSGTLSLRCALAGIPGVITQKIHPLSYFLARRWVKIPHIGMANILLQRESVPEYIQGEAKPSVLCEKVAQCLQDPRRIEGAQRDAEALKTVLGAPPDMTVAEWLLSSLEEKF
ncbi:MAG: lipid-A-disaccharide synthase [Puniceicoccales bacterium]|jgi:lipid-A-disaccharide synthase|nr:lipid-A-disaccharide synthase [Puniceicoccales bacterium]